MVTRIGIWLVIIAFSPSRGTEIEPFTYCGRDGWKCDKNPEEATYDCRDLPGDKPTDFTQYKEEYRRGVGNNWWMSEPWSKASTSSSKVQRLVYENCKNLLLDLEPFVSVRDYLTVRNVVNLRFASGREDDTDKLDCDPRESVLCRFVKEVLSSSEHVRWPKHLELKDVGFFSTEWTINGTDLTDLNLENVNITSYSLNGHLENARVSMTNVTFNRLNFNLKNGNFTMRKSLFGHDEDLRNRLAIVADNFLFEDNTGDETEHFFFDLTVKTAVITGNTFNYMHPKALSDVQRDTTANSTTRFIFSNNKITHLDETALDVSGMDPRKIFDIIKLENNTIDCSCRNIEFMERTQRNNIPVRLLLLFRTFAEKNFCLTGPKCKPRKINSVKNFEVLCTEKPFDDDGCLKGGDEVPDHHLPNNNPTVIVNSSSINEETVAKILWSFFEKNLESSNKTSKEALESKTAVSDLPTNTSLVPNWFLVIVVMFIVGVFVLAAYPFVRRLIETRTGERSLDYYRETSGSRTRLTYSRPTSEIEITENGPNRD